ncbi:MAG: hypothetical protein JXR37_16650 [Kiritimatiellae bacterium]|nr:hypothetical protein [Kiritimatiellia bacterium]
MSTAFASVPPRFQMSVLGNEGRGGEPDTLQIAVPLTTAPGEAFTVHVAALSARCEPTVHAEGTVRVECAEAGFEPVEVRFEKGRPAVALIENVLFEREGLFRFCARLNGDVFRSNPTHCRADHAYRIAWGDPHVHTILSNCHAKQARSLNFAYSAGRYVSGLQWVCAADHVSNGRCALPQWREETETSNNYDDPPAFVTLPGYEASLKGGCGGDNNIYMRRWPDYFVDHYEEGNVKTLLGELGGKLEAGAFFAVPHHTSRPGKHGEIPLDLYPGSGLMPAVEITSCWGNSEYRGNPDPLKKVHDGPCYVADLLNQGLPLGFLGGTDTHVSNPFQLDHRPPDGHLTSDPGGTGCFVRSLSRDSVFDAMRARNCYAGKRERTYLDVRVNDRRGGEIHRSARDAEPRTVRFQAAGACPIRTVEIIRNGTCLHAVPGCGWAMRGEVRDDAPLADVLLAGCPLERFVYYYVRVAYASGACAWSSPVWFVPD